MRTIFAADLYCGAGGTSSGLRRACDELGLGLDLLAVNHWPIAVQTHTANHPAARHLCADVDTLNPRVAVPGGKLDLLVASPECTHFSSARGGRPVNDQKRASAWHVLRWCEALHVSRVLIENVPEFRSWGPLSARGKPLKSRKGETYRAFLAALRSLGYRVEDRVLNAADYGDPTTRQRLFIIAQKGSRPIRWPEPTHARHPDLFGRRRWKAAREVIDWSVPGTSIFSRKRPLSPATMRRILAGLERFGGEELRPFLVVLRGTSTARPIEDPVPSLTAEGERLGVAEPFLLHVTHGGRERSVDEPVPTVTGAHRGELGLVEPFVLGQHSGGVARSTEDPLPTVATDGAIALVEPFILPPLGVHHRGGKANKARSMDDPLQTVTSRGGGHVVQPYLVPWKGEREGQAPRTHAIDEPLPTVATGPNFGLVEPYLTTYYRTGQAVPVSEPVPTVTTRDRIALVMPVVNGRALDIRFRMLQPHELSRAMGFEDGYQFHGNREQRVKQIGNAVAVHMATALCIAALRPLARTEPEIEEATA